MGLYPDRGVEYVVRLRNWSQFIVAGTRATDPRLAASKFYQRRKHEWFKDTRTGSVPLHPVDVAELDIKLTAGERRLLDISLKRLGDQVGLWVAWREGSEVH